MGFIQRESEGYCRCRAHDPPRWALHGAEEVRQAGVRAALMGLPWGSTDAWNFPLISNLLLYLGDKASEAVTVLSPTLPHLFSGSPPALLLPQTFAGQQQSC